MNNRITISEELKALESDLSPEIHGTPYQVPQGYFEGLPAAILARIKLDQLDATEEIFELSPLLAGLSRKMPFEVPRDYFGNNAITLQEINVEEESLVLSFINKDMPYEVPAGYFANFPEKMLEKLTRQEAKVIPIMRRKWMRMAVAATLTGIMAISGFLYFNNRNEISPAGTETVSNELKQVSSEELDAFIKSTTAGNQPSASDNVTASEDANDLLNDVSDKELEAFLSGVPVEDLPASDENLDMLYN
ncbi:MAG: hypothetical protein ACXWB9_00940 [Flavisolibacter sp.]